jgi:hypothetical protein
MKINHDKIRPATNAPLGMWDEQTDRQYKCLIHETYHYKIGRPVHSFFFMFLGSEFLDVEGHNQVNQKVYKLELKQKGLAKRLDLHHSQ